MKKTKISKLTVLLCVLTLVFTTSASILLPSSTVANVSAEETIIETAPVVNLAAGANSHWGFEEGNFTANAGTDSEHGVYSEAEYGETYATTFKDVALYANNAMPAYSRTATFAKGAYEFSFWYKAEDIDLSTEKDSGGDPRGGGIAAWAHTKNSLNIDGTDADVFTLWDWRQKPGGGNYMCYVISEDADTWTYVSYQFERGDMFLGAVTFDIANVVAATGKLKITDITLRYLQQGETDFNGTPLTAAQKDLIGSDTNESVVERFAVEGAGITKSYDETVRFNSSSNGSVKIESSSTALDQRAFIRFNQDQFFNTNYLVTFYIKTDNLMFDSAWSGWPLGINVYDRMFYRDGAEAGHPVGVGDGENISGLAFAKDYPSKSSVMLKGFVGILPGEAGLPERVSASDWHKVQYLINPWTIWSNVLKADGSAYPEYFLDIGLRIFNTSGTIWLDDLSVVPQGGFVPSYTATEPQLSVQGSLPSVQAEGQLLTLPRATARDGRNNDISGDITLTVTDPDGVNVLDAVEGDSAQSFTPDKAGAYTVTYRVEASGVPSTKEFTINVGEFRAITLENVIADGTRNTNFSVAAPTVVEPDGTTAVTDASVKVYKTSPLGTKTLVGTYDSFFGTSFTPDVAGKWLVTYEYEYTSDSESYTIIRLYEVNVVISPLDIGKGDYDGIYLEGWHFEEVASDSELITDLGIRYWPGDTSVVSMSVKRDGGHSGNNYMRVDYKEAQSVVNFFVLVDLKATPMVKDDVTTYTLGMYIRMASPIEASGDEDAFVLFQIMLKETISTEPYALIIRKQFTIEEVNAMTDWTRIELTFTSYSDETLFGDDFTANADAGEIANPAPVNFSIYTGLFAELTLVNATGAIDVDDGFIVKEGDEEPDYVTEFENGTVDPDPDPDPDPVKKGCKGTVSGEYAAILSALCLIPAGLTAAKKRKISRNR